MNLIPLREFYREAPAEISNSKTTKPNEHLQRLGRLEYENQQRKEMNQAYLKLEGGKEDLENKILDKKSKLENLKPQLADILEVRGIDQTTLN